MATAPNKQSDEQDLSSRKPRRSVIRSLSWKRANKRTKMDESEQEHGFNASVDASIHINDDSREEVGGRSFNTTVSSTHGMSEEDTEDTIFNDSTASNSNKRKKAGVWKAVKRFFTRKSGKGSKSFTTGDSRSPHGVPQRSVSDPNLIQRSGERPDIAPIEQVDETPMETQSPPKKAISHDSLLLELRSKQKNDVDNEDGISPVTQQASVVVQSKPPDIDWQASPSATPEKLLPGLNVSHDKIRVAPRHRRAPTRKGVSSVRQGGRDITDGDVIPRSKSVGARMQGNVLVEQPQDPKALQEERENLKKRMEMVQRQRQQEEEEAKQKQLEHEKQKIEQEKLEQQMREQEKLEQERLEKQKLEEEKLQQEKMEKERLEQEKLEKEKLEQEKQERLEKEKLEQEKLEKLKLEQEKLEKLKQEKVEQEKRKQEKLEQERLDEENRKQQEKDKSNQYNIQHLDFSDLTESLRPSDNSKETFSVETSEVEMKETTPEEEPNTSRDISEIRDVALHQNIDTNNVKTEERDRIKEQETSAVLDIEINNTADDRQTVSDHASLPTAESVTASTNQEIREINEVNVVEQSEESQPMSISEEDVHSENITSKHPEIVKAAAVGEKISEDNTVVTVKREESPPLSPSSSATPGSPVRSKRLVIETPEKVYQKPIMPEVRTEEAKTMENGPRGIQRKRPQSMHSRIRPVVEETNRTQDDSNLGVAKLKQAFERSSRSQTVSYGDRRKKPEVLPKPKPASKPSKSQTLEKNYRFPVVTANKPHETETSVQKNPKKQSDDVVVVLDEVPNEAVEKKASVPSSPTKKAPPPKPKPLRKPQPKMKPTMPNATTKTPDEGKENMKKTPNTPSVTNGSVKMSDSTDGHTGEVSADAQSDLPSFWARRSIFSPEQKTNNSMPSQEEKTREKHSPFIQLKTDTCAVCGSKVYQMEKFKVKDNIVHRSCIKCSVCKRLLSVGNFIMSQNKIYCKPHEPHVVISLPAV